MKNKLNINNTIKAITSQWQAQPGALLREIDDLEKSIHKKLPNDYRSFLQWSNGGNCKFSNIYIDLWPAGLVEKLNQEYQISKYLGVSYVGIGTDGGSICIALDYTSTQPQICTFDLGDIDLSRVNQIGKTFSETIDMAIAGSLTELNVYQ
ncbi:SMI1/KNR4 family protein [Pseudomonas sp. NPDC089392]|uniref:SMI1/KNR4 family protein n=1 Tax=Pseudomonas sp. NPDC089392 TaxID=3364459 RepID=UPI003818068E